MSDIPGFLLLNNVTFFCFRQYVLEANELEDT